jgi:hypothetical protein
MPSQKKMRAIRRRAAGKVSPLSPEPKKPVKKPKTPPSTVDKGKQKRALEREKAGRAPQQKPRNIRAQITKTMRGATAAKKAAAAAKKATVKPPKVKTSGAVKKAVTPIATRGFIRTMLGFGSRVVAPVALAVTGTSLAAPVFRHLFPKTEAWKSTPELKARQKRTTAAIKKMGKKQTPSQQIHGGGAPYVGQQPDPGKSLKDLEKAEKAFRPFELTGSVKVEKTTPKVKKNRFTASGVRLPRDADEPSMEKKKSIPIKSKVPVREAVSTERTTGRIKPRLVHNLGLPYQYLNRHMYEAITRKPDKKSKVSAKRDTSKTPVKTPSLKAPESDLKKDSRKDFAKYNKPGSKLGMKMDDILRGAFSFMGALPKSTAKDKWKNK